MYQLKGPRPLLSHQRPPRSNFDVLSYPREDTLHYTALPEQSGKSIQNMNKLSKYVSLYKQAPKKRAKVLVNSIEQAHRKVQDLVRLTDLNQEIHNTPNLKMLMNNQKNLRINRESLETAESGFNFAQLKTESTKWDRIADLPDSEIRKEDNHQVLLVDSERQLLEPKKRVTEDRFRLTTNKSSASLEHSCQTLLLNTQDPMAEGENPTATFRSKHGEDKISDTSNHEKTSLFERLLGEYRQPVADQEHNGMDTFRSEDCSSSAVHSAMPLQSRGICQNFSNRYNRQGQQPTDRTKPTAFFVGENGETIRNSDLLQSGVLGNTQEFLRIEDKMDRVESLDLVQRAFNFSNKEKPLPLPHPHQEQTMNLTPLNHKPRGSQDITEDTKLVENRSSSLSKNGKSSKGFTRFAVAESRLHGTSTSEVGMTSTSKLHEPKLSLGSLSKLVQREANRPHQVPVQSKIEEVEPAMVEAAVKSPIRDRSLLGASVQSQGIVQSLKKTERLFRFCEEDKQRRLKKMTEALQKQPVLKREHQSLEDLRNSDGSSSFHQAGVGRVLSNKGPPVLVRARNTLNVSKELILPTISATAKVRAPVHESPETNQSKKLVSALKPLNHTIKFMDGVDDSTHILNFKDDPVPRQKSGLLSSNQICKRRIPIRQQFNIRKQGLVAKREAVNLMEKSFKHDDFTFDSYKEGSSLDRNSGSEEGSRESNSSQLRGGRASRNVCYLNFITQSKLNAKVPKVEQRLPDKIFLPAAKVPTAYSVKKMTSSVQVQSLEISSHATDIGTSALPTNQVTLQPPDICETGDHFTIERQEQQRPVGTSHDLKRRFNPFIRRPKAIDKERVHDVSAIEKQITSKLVDDLTGILSSTQQQRGMDSRQTSPMNSSFDTRIQPSFRTQKKNPFSRKLLQKLPLKPLSRENSKEMIMLGSRAPFSNEYLQP